MIPRPRFRLPIVAAPLIVGAAYVLRSLVIRGGDFSVDRTDIVVAIVVAVAALLVGWARRDDARLEADADDDTDADE